MCSRLTRFNDTDSRMAMVDMCMCMCMHCIDHSTTKRCQTHCRGVAKASHVVELIAGRPRSDRADPPSSARKYDVIGDNRYTLGAVI
jgi:hypothetical protein